MNLGNFMRDFLIKIKPVPVCGSQTFELNFGTNIGQKFHMFGHDRNGSSWRTSEFYERLCGQLKKARSEKARKSIKESDLDFSDSHTKKCSSCDDCVHTAMSAALTLDVGTNQHLWVV